MGPDEQPALDRADEQAIWDAIEDGRAVDDPRLAAAAAERAQQMVASNRWLFVLAGVTVPPALALLLAHEGEQVSWPVVLAFGAVVGAAGLLPFGSASAALRANRALAAGVDPPARPSWGQRLGWAALALLLGNLIARALGAAAFVASRVVEVELESLLPRGGWEAIGLFVTVLFAVPCYRAFAERQAASSSH